MFGSKPKSNLLRIAHFSTSLASRSPGEIDGSLLASTYRRRLALRGVSTGHGQLRIQPLLREVSGLLTGLGEIPVFQRFFASDASALDFLPDIARRRPKRGHPLKHACMLALLFEDWSDFQNEFETSQLHVADMELDFRSHAIGAHRSQSTRNAFLDVVRNGTSSIRSASQAAGVSTTTGLQWAAKVGYPIRRRPKKLKPATLEQVRTLLALGLPKVDVARTAGISAVTLSRFLARDQALDEIWMVARLSGLRELNRNRLTGCIESRPGVPIGVIRKLGASGYQWLYRNDRDWLRQKIAVLRSPSTSKHSTKRIPQDPERGPTA